MATTQSAFAGDKRVDKLTIGREGLAIALFIAPGVVACATSTTTPWPFNDNPPDAAPLEGGSYDAGFSGDSSRDGALEASQPEAGAAADAGDSAPPLPSIQTAIQPVYASSLCVDVPGGQMAAGAFTELDPCGTSASQQFTLVRAADGSFTIQTATSSLCLDSMAGGSSSQTINAEETVCSGSFTQHWRIEPSSTSGAYAIMTQDGTGCLDVTGAGSSAGTQLILWPCSGTISQQNEIFLLPGVTMPINSGTGTFGTLPTPKSGCTSDSWGNFVSGFSNTYCTSCHSQFGSYDTFVEYGDISLGQMSAGLMPQSGSPMPSQTDIAKITSWVQCGCPQ
jgi:hypothetical protein